MSELLRPAAANEEQIAYWNAAAAAKWVASQERMDRQLEPLGALVIEASAPGAGESVLDVGCGCGATSLALARRVGPTGRVLGVDISAPMLARAEARAVEAGLAQLRFVRADAQTAALAPASVDLLYSRFGVMFFADPVAAFAKLREALRPGGRVAFICWQALERNPLMLLPARAAGEHLELPPRAPPRAPGPFAFAEEGYARSILEAAGFHEVDVAPASAELLVGGGGDLDDATRYSLLFGPAASAVEQATPELRLRVEASLRATLAPHAGPEGVRLPAALWLVRARR